MWKCSDLRNSVYCASVSLRRMPTFMKILGTTLFGNSEECTTIIISVFLCLVRYGYYVHFACGSFQTSSYYWIWLFVSGLRLFFFVRVGRVLETKCAVQRFSNSSSITTHTATKLYAKDAPRCMDLAGQPVARGIMLRVPGASSEIGSQYRILSFGVFAMRLSK